MLTFGGIFIVVNVRYANNILFTSKNVRNVSHILRSLLFLITDCCALLKTVQYEHVLWTCTNNTWHYHYHYFMSIMCFVSCINVITIVLLYQMFLKTIFIRIMPY